jgi:hypothetical protein
MRTRAYVIQQTVEDLVADFLYYDRKSDPELPQEEIQDAIKNSELTPEDIVDWFRAELLRRMK